MIQVVLEIKVSTVAKSTLIVLLYVNSSTFFVDSEANKKKHGLWCICKNIRHRNVMAKHYFFILEQITVLFALYIIVREN